MRVWIDQDLCTGDGLCAEIAPDVFFMHDDGLAYVKEVVDPTGLGPDGQPKHQMTSTVEFPESMIQDVIDAAEDCPGDCIFIEVD